MNEFDKVFWTEEEVNAFILEEHRNERKGYAVLMLIGFFGLLSGIYGPEICKPGWCLSPLIAIGFGALANSKNSLD